MKVLRIFNRQKSRAINARFLRRATVFLLRDLLGVTDYELAVHLVDPEEMTRINQTFLGHEGSTDVITFDNSEEGAGGLSGELFISVADAAGYARTFRSTWQSEVVRYVAHGVLHLRGYDDTEPGLRRTMKYHENRLLKALAKQYELEQLERPGPALSRQDDMNLHETK